MAFAFNGDYGDLEQVAALLAAFDAVHDELVARGRHTDNDAFRGTIAGAVGPDEETAIYVLQGLRRLRAAQRRVADALASGYEEVTRVVATDAPRPADGSDAVRDGDRLAHVVFYELGRGGGWAAWTDARLIADSRGGVHGVLPKGQRTRGHLREGRGCIVRRRAEAQTTAAAA